jgi:hypothetical protein
MMFLFDVYFCPPTYQEIKKREKPTLHIPVVNFGAKQAIPTANETGLFVGSVATSK